MTQEFEREPTTEELAQELEYDTETVKELLSYAEKTAYLEAPVNNSEDKITLLDVLPNNNNDLEEERYELKQQIDSLLSRLPERDAQIIKMYYGIGVSHKYTLDEIAKQMGLTRERIRQIKTKAMRKLKAEANKL